MRSCKYIQNQKRWLKRLKEGLCKKEKSSFLRTAIAAQLKKLKERELKYNELERQLKESGATQISTTDPESRSMLINHNILEVSYNLQAISDEKHSLVAHFEITNENDTKALFKITNDTKEELEQATITVLADKGYSTGEQMSKCEKEDIITLVAPRDTTSVKHLEEKYLVNHFSYKTEEDTYTCPEGNTLTTNGIWSNRSHDDHNRKNSTQYKVKQYKKPACLTCPVMQQCTLNKRGSMISRSEH